MQESVAESLSGTQDTADESGSAPGDRKFRADVEGLRAVAIVLVVLYHGGLNFFSGGYVGVDVFFVISGFVITGVLLRERASTGRTSFLTFYGRRSRRIIPAATLVILATVLGTYVVLGALYGNPTAADARWTSVFLANFHFASTGTNYLNAQEPPSPLLNFWSLAVEEQFYLVYPMVFLLIAGLRTKFSLRARLAVGLVLIIIVSFTFSVIQTNVSPTLAYFSPFTRAWELALGALVCVGTEWLLRLPNVVGGVLTWIGLGAIGFSAVVFGASTVYPGSLVAVPVIGTGLVIAGGTASPRWAAESLLGLRPFRWMGRLSYSLYLWHWPLLIIAAESYGKASLPFHQNLVWLVAALVAAIGTYKWVENPVRHARILRRGWAPIAFGIMLVAVSLIVATLALDTHQAGESSTSTGRTGATAIVPLSSVQLNHLLSAAASIRFLPTDLAPPLATVRYDWGGQMPPCFPAIGQSVVPPTCVAGDPHGTHTMVVYGDSHAAMWFEALNDIALRTHWKLIDLGKGYCPADSLPYANPPGWGTPGGEYAACDQWHRFAINMINQVRPSLVIVTQEIRGRIDGSSYTPRQWQRGLELTLRQLHVAKGSVVVLGNIPLLPQSGPECLADNATNVQHCSGAITTGLSKFNRAEQLAAGDAGARYVSVTPWFCSTDCPAVVGRYNVYLDQFHVTGTYSLVLQEVLAKALGFPGTGR
jgi:peptidoglycan/LPS O-acetylase OafA/YrhL